MKYSAYTALNAAKSPISARKHVVLTTLSKPEPAASRIAPTFLQLCAACASMPSGISPVSGSTGICPEAKTNQFVIYACEYGPNAPGAFLVSTTFMSVSFQYEHGHCPNCIIINLTIKATSHAIKHCFHYIKKQTCTLVQICLFSDTAYFLLTALTMPFAISRYTMKSTPAIGHMIHVDSQRFVTKLQPRYTARAMPQ